VGAFGSNGPHTDQPASQYYQQREQLLCDQVEVSCSGLDARIGTYIMQAPAAHAD